MAHITLTPEEEAQRSAAAQAYIKGMRPSQDRTNRLSAFLEGWNARHAQALADAEDPDERAFREYFAGTKEAQALGVKAHDVSLTPERFRYRIAVALPDGREWIRYLGSLDVPVAGFLYQFGKDVSELSVNL